jgi:hypothetical protein
MTNNLRVLKRNPVGVIALILAIETLSIATPFWAKCEDEIHTPKSGNLESFGTPENLELDCRGKNTSHWGVLYINVAY